MSPPKSTFICKRCGVETTRLSDLYRHQAVHNTDRRLYMCPYCNKGFTQKCNLKVHINSKHTDPSERKWYKCSHEGCGKSYKDPSACIRHEKNLDAHPQSLTAGESSFTTNQATAIRGSNEGRNVIIVRSAGEPASSATHAPSASRSTGGRVTEQGLVIPQTPSSAAAPDPNHATNIDTEDILSEGASPTIAWDFGSSASTLSVVSTPYSKVIPDSVLADSESSLSSNLRASAQFGFGHANVEAWLSSSQGATLPVIGSENSLGLELGSNFGPSSPGEGNQILELHTTYRELVQTNESVNGNAFGFDAHALDRAHECRSAVQSSAERVVPILHVTPSTTYSARDHNSCLTSNETTSMPPPSSVFEPGSLDAGTWDSLFGAAPSFLDWGFGSSAPIFSAPDTSHAASLAHPLSASSNEFPELDFSLNTGDEPELEWTAADTDAWFSSLTHTESSSINSGNDYDTQPERSSDAAGPSSTGMSSTGMSSDHNDQTLDNYYDPATDFFDFHA